MDAKTHAHGATERPEITRELAPEDAATGSGGEGRIKCPLCGWTPGAEDTWWCDCGHEWNTFDTGGVCPGCLKQWKMTKCPACGRWSAHSDWYPKG